MLEYTALDQQLHQLSQVLAKANRSFIPAIEDDSHTNLAFDSLGKRIMGRWIHSTSNKIMLTYHLPSQNYEWINGNFQVLITIPSLDKTISQIESEIAITIAQLNLDASGYTLPMHYEIPEYSFKGQKVEAFSKNQLDTWMHYRLIANEACHALLEHLALNTEIRIWPHHFDTGLYINVNSKLGIGFGLAMEDQMAGAPYFYMAGYGLQNPLSYNQLPTLSSGRWEIGPHWNGAILPLTELEENPLSGAEFIQESLNSFLSISA
jgi:hypothetical protein